MTYFWRHVRLQQHKFMSQQASQSILQDDLVLGQKMFKFRDQIFHFADIDEFSRACGASCHLPPLKQQIKSVPNNKKVKFQAIFCSTWF
jgi:hypothetical protein